VQRRGFLTSLSGCLLVAPLVAEAQQTRKAAPRIAFLTTTSPDDSPNPGPDGFRQGLRDIGYVEGQTIAIEWRWGRGRTDQFPKFAAEVVRLKVDVIVAANTPAGRAALMATKTIPIVIPFMGDPVGDGFAATFAHPGGNVTGLTATFAELIGKRLQLFKEALPNLSRIGVVVDTSDANYRESVSNLEAAAQALGVRVQIRREVSNPGELGPTFAAIPREGAGGVFIVGGGMTYVNRAQLVELALKHHLPMACPQAQAVRAGCLMSYAVSPGDLFRRAAIFVDKILKGAKPADLPIEQPTKFELVINLKTAKALSLTIPPSVLARADQVIE